jgi:ABC-type nitrate/sulfonate/bicarbonate transport system substrate-binding protein
MPPEIMKPRRRGGYPSRIGTIVLAACLLVAGEAHAGDRVRLAFSSFSATNAGFLTAIEEKLFERRGIDLTHVYIASSAVVLPAVITREVDFATLSGETAARAYHQGAEPGDRRDPAR